MKLPKGIRLRSNGKFEYNVMVKGSRLTGTCGTLEEAMMAKLDAARRVQEGNAARPCKSDTMSITLEAAVDLTVKYRWDGLKYAEEAAHNADRVLEYFGLHTPVMDIDTERVNDFIDHLKAIGNSDGTINRKLTALSVVLRTTEEHGKPTARPTIRRRKEYRGRERFVTPEEEKEILELLERRGKNDLKDCFTCLIDTGLRCGELLSLTKGDVNYEQGQHGTITVWRTKNNKPRSVPMTKRVSMVIKQRTEYIKGPKLFPENMQWITRGWKMLREAMGLQHDKQFIPHALRHTCASRLVQSGVSIPIVKAWMGHESIQSTMRYAHLSPSTLYEVVGVLEKFTPNK